MLKHKLLIPFLLIIPFFSFAQGLYIGVNGGYGFPVAKASMGDNTETNLAGTTTYTSHSISLGKGINAGLTIGYMFNKNIGAEIDASYLIGGKNTRTIKTEGFVSNSNEEIVWQGKMLRVIPSFRLVAGEGKLHPYMTAGLIVGLLNKMTSDDHHDVTSSFPGFATSSAEKAEYSGGISLGVHASLGLNYMISDKIGIFLEGSGNYQNWAPKKATIKTSVIDGVDQIPSMTTSQIETDFEDSYTDTAGSTSQPSRATKFYLPFSSIGLNLGLHIAFGSKE